MRTLLLLGLAVGGAFMAGWFTIERDGDRTRIEINKTEIRSDTRQAIDRGREILDERERNQLASQDNGQAWPPQNGSPVQGAGYNAPAGFNGGYPPGQNASYGNSPPNYNPQSAPYNGGGYPPAGNFNQGGGYDANYPPPGSAAPPQRWSGAPQQPAPWGPTR